MPLRRKIESILEITGISEAEEGAAVIVQWKALIWLVILFIVTDNNFNKDNTKD
jgi:uncharacterized membrane protein YtjA (UPF0391 family)